MAQGATRQKKWPNSEAITHRTHSDIPDEQSPTRPLQHDSILHRSAVPVDTPIIVSGSFSISIPVALPIGTSVVSTAIAPAWRYELTQVVIKDEIRQGEPECLGSFSHT
jgi:hypothetical protein